jgi:hypothetical protein
LQAENVRPSEIHRRIVAVYGEHVMNAASVRKWCTTFRNVQPTYLLILPSSSSRSVG